MAIQPFDYYEWEDICRWADTSCDPDDRKVKGRAWAEVQTLMSKLKMPNPEGETFLDEAIGAFCKKCGIEFGLNGRIARFVQLPGDEESKGDIAYALCKVIQKTRAGDDLLTLDYSIDPQTLDETVTAGFCNSRTKRVNVSGDSAWMLIRDVVNQLDIG